MVADRQIDGAEREEGGFAKGRAGRAGREAAWRARPGEVLVLGFVEEREQEKRSRSEGRRQDIKKTRVGVLFCPLSSMAAINDPRAQTATSD